MRYPNLVLVSFFVLVIGTQIILAQNYPSGNAFKKAQISSELSISVGGSHYFGDLNAYVVSNLRINREMHKENIRPLIGVNYRFYPSRFFNPRFSLVYTRLYGSDKENKVDDQFSSAWYRKYRNLTVRTELIELSASVEINLFGFLPADGRHFFSPYLLGGFGLILFDPKAPYNPEWMSKQSAEHSSPIPNNGEYDYTDWVRLRPLGTEGQGLPGYGEKYNLIQPIVIFGGGFKFNVSSSLTMSWELSYHHTFTDYLDDVSTVYPDVSEFYNHYSPEKAQMAANLSKRTKEIDANGDYSYIVGSGQQRGSSKYNDAYMVSTITVGYKLNNKTKSYNVNPKRIQKQQDRREKKEDMENKKGKRKKLKRSNKINFEYLNKRSSKKGTDLTKK